MRADDRDWAVYELDTDTLGDYEGVFGTFYFLVSDDEACEAFEKNMGSADLDEIESSGTIPSSLSDADGVFARVADDD